MLDELIELVEYDTYGNVLLSGTDFAKNYMSPEEITIITEEFFENEGCHLG